MHEKELSEECDTHNLEEWWCKEDREHARRNGRRKMEALGCTVFCDCVEWTWILHRLFRANTHDSKCSGYPIGMTSVTRLILSNFEGAFKPIEQALFGCHLCQAESFDRSEASIFLRVVLATATYP
ncbi:hypothetical protein X777_02609 [Ooceraea biroi]|uniref:Uncharacterized protein n=1 Tax=Ooceraea biroi TaxID=2015173 RepID=A0A026WN28_OOCBI|nr:hypothetical protein X777_02609 [Ooceraea biroi]